MSDDPVQDLLLMAREHPLAFAVLTLPNYKPQRFHRDIAAALKRIEAGELKRLMIFMPPRYGKSELASVRFPAWCLGRHPDWRFIQTSYSTDLARDFGRKARDLLGTNEFKVLFPGVKVSRDSKAADEWNLSGSDGGYLAAGVGAGITGKGADIALIDDPFKDDQEAQSKLARDRVWAWYQTTFSTRQQGMSAIIVICTRWHSDDLAGRLLDQMHICLHCGVEDKKHSAEHPFEMLGDPWEVLEFPALSETPDGLKALWPERHTVTDLLKRKAQDPRSFSALFQQSPSPDEGTTFQREWFQNRYEHLPEGCWYFQAADTAFKTGVGNDFSVVATWATDGRDYYLCHLWRDRVEYPDLKRRLQDLAERFRPRAILVEDAASGQSVIQDLKRNTPLPVIAVPTKGASKENRADAITGLFEAGRVFLPEKAPWLDEYIEEHIGFPNATHDDQVDTTSLALGWASLRKSQPRQMLEMTTTNQPKNEYVSYWARKRGGRSSSAIPEPVSMPRAR